MGYIGQGANTDAIVGQALQISSDGCAEIANLLTDITTDADIDAANTVAADYGVTLSADLSVSTANGAMVIDDLMQKISTKVQVAAQMLSAANNMAKTASRILSQG